MGEIEEIKEILTTEREVIKELLDWLTNHNLGVAALSEYTPFPHEVFVFDAIVWAEQLKKWQEMKGGQSNE